VDPPIPVVAVPQQDWVVKSKVEEMIKERIDKVDKELREEIE
jgi:hypothetical protein